MIVRMPPADPPEWSAPEWSAPGWGAPAWPGPTRRSVLRCAVLSMAALSALGGCGIRLQVDAPGLSQPQRTPAPDEATLVQAFQDATSLSQMAGRVSGGAPAAPAPLVAQLAGIHALQAEVLHARLAAAGVPESIVTAPSATGTPTVAVSAPGPATAADLAGAEAVGVSPGSLGLVAAATSANRLLLTAIAAQQGAAAQQLGATLTWPAPPPLPPDAAATLLEATRSVAYAFEIVAAQLAGGSRAAALGTSSELAARAQELTAMAGSAASPEPLGYALPFPATTPEAANRLASTVLTRLVAVGLAPVPLLPHGSPAHTTVVRLQVQAQAIAFRWGVGPLPFPGMAYP